MTTQQPQPTIRRFAAALSIFVIACSSAFACSPKRIDLSHLAAQAEGVYVGVVTGQIWTALENRLRGGARFPDFRISDEHEVRVFVQETLKGPARTVVTIPIRGCAYGYGRTHEVVVVFRNADGSGLVRPASSAAAEMRALLQSHR